MADFRMVYKWRKSREVLEIKDEYALGSRSACVYCLYAVLVKVVVYLHDDVD